MAEAQSPLAEFLIELTKALSRTGYYSADHPEARRSSELVLAKYHGAVQDSELRLSMVQKGETRDLLVAAGDFDDEPISKLMRPSMAELFKPKLLDFMGRWDIVAFTFARAARDEEILAFLELMTRPLSAQAAEDSKRLDEELIERGARSVTILFSADMVGSQRKLSWQAALALSHLRKDVARLPLFRGATDEIVRRMRRETLVEIFRPLKQPRLLAEILLNLDLAPEVAALGSEAVSAAASRVRLAAAAALEREHGHPVLPSPGPERAVEVLVDLLATLDEPDVVEEAADLAERLGTWGVDWSRVAPGIRERFDRRRLAAAWLKDLDTALAYVGADTRVDADAERVAGELIRQRRWVEAAAVVRRLGSMTPPEIFLPVMQRLVDVRTIDAVCGDFSNAENDVPRRAALLGVLCASGARGLEPAADLLATEHDVAALVTALTGPEAELLLATALGRPAPDPLLVRVLLSAAAKRPSPVMVPALCRLAGAADSGVRRLALAALVPLGRVHAEDALAAALADDDPEVRRFAIAALAALPSRRMDVLARYADLLLADGPAPLAVRMEAMTALSRLGRTPVPGGRTAEKVLLESLRQAPRGFAARLLSPGRARDELYVATCRALGATGSADALAELDGLAAAGRTAVRQAAARAAADLRARAGGEGRPGG